MFVPASQIFLLFGILAAIALPAYQDYISKSQTTRVVGELAAAKTAVDAALFAGKIPAFKDEAGTGGAKSKENIGLVKNIAQPAVEFASSDAEPPRSNLLSKVAIRGDLKKGAGAGSIVGTLGNNANTDIAGAEIAQTRDATGVWECQIYADTNKVTGWKEKFIPSGCKKLDAAISDT